MLKLNVVAKQAGLVENPEYRSTHGEAHFVLKLGNRPCHMRAKMGADQFVHPRSPVSAFVFRCLFCLAASVNIFFRVDKFPSLPH